MTRYQDELGCRDAHKNIWAARLSSSNMGDKWMAFFVSEMIKKTTQ